MRVTLTPSDLQFEWCHTNGQHSWSVTLFGGENFQLERIVCVRRSTKSFDKAWCVPNRHTASSESKWTQNLNRIWTESEQNLNSKSEVKNQKFRIWTESKLQIWTPNASNRCKRSHRCLFVASGEMCIRPIRSSDWLNAWFFECLSPKSLSAEVQQLNRRSIRGPN